MIHFEDRMVDFGHTRPKPIVAWAVWFETPFGLCSTLDLAVERCKSCDIDPELCIIPVAVAQTQDSYEVCRRQ